MLGTKRTTILAIAGVVTLIVAMAAPVSAKGKPPPKPADTVSVTMEFVDPHPGIATPTNCGDGGGFLTMNREGDFLRADWADVRTTVEMNLPVAWNRDHPMSQSGTAFTGCHGGLVTDSEPGFAGYFILDGAPDGTVSLSSRFDYYWKYDSVEKGNSGKFVEVQTVLELFEINAELGRIDGEPFDWSATGVEQVVVGDFELRRFEKVADGSGVGWETFDFDADPVPITMTITISE